MAPPLGCEEVVVSEEAAAAIASLPSNGKEGASILRRITAVRSLLRGDCQGGEVIPVPLGKSGRALEAKHGSFENLYCVDLPAFWRLLYTIIRIEGKRYVVVLEVVDHQQYDKWFPNKGR